MTDTQPTPHEPKRGCQRPGCERSAFATVVFDYAAQAAAVGPLRPEKTGQGVDLCHEHAAGFTTPAGWEVLWYDFSATAHEPDADADADPDADAGPLGPGADPLDPGADPLDAISGKP